MNTKLCAVIASTIGARARCEQTGATEWFNRHSDTLQAIERDYLPHGSGIDNGVGIDVYGSNEEKIVLTLGYHHMNDGGYYDGWTEHKAIITPAFTGGLKIRITGRDRNQIKEYLHDVLYTALTQDYEYPQAKAA